MKKKSDPVALIERAVEAGDVVALNELVFGDELSAGQVEILHGILFGEGRRLCVVTHTRYGKTYTISKAALLWVLFGLGEVLIVAPQSSQASKVMQYVADHVVESPIMRQMVDTPGGDIARLRKEVSKQRITFRNGCSIRILSAHGDANRLMGEGGSLNLIDEACLIDDDVYRAKISRMVEGDNATRVLISNPWHKMSFFYDAWKSDRYRNIHIGWEQGVSEGRISKNLIDEQRETLTEMEFGILYDAIFPDSTEDALIPYHWIVRALNAEWDVDGDPVHGIDCAERGGDETVHQPGRTDGSRYVLEGPVVWDVEDTMDIVHRATAAIPAGEETFIDSIGVGAGVYSRLAEVGHNAVSVRVSQSPTAEPERFLNLKSQYYWRLRTLFEEGRVRLTVKDDLQIRQLTGLRWELTAGGKIRIVDPPGRSPDRADAMMLACCGQADVRASVTVARLSAGPARAMQALRGLPKMR